MFGLAEDTDLEFLKGAVLEQVCIGAHEVIFRFEQDLSITVESDFLVALNEVGQRFEDTRSSANACAALLGEQIVDVHVLPEGTLAVEFSAAKRLELYDSSPNYESYQITHGLKTIVI